VQTLTSVASLDDIRDAIRVFNDSSFDQGLSVDLLSDTRYWVQDPANGNFGPSKFCGFQNLSSTEYQDARRGQWEGASFNGTHTRKAIEDVVGVLFEPNEALKREFIDWAAAKFGHDVLDRISPDSVTKSCVRCVGTGRSKCRRSATASL
jgi:hypothetical protein